MATSSDLLIVFAAAVAVLLAHWTVSLLHGAIDLRRRQQQVQPSFDQIRIIFEGDLCISANRAALDILDVKNREGVIWHNVQQRLGMRFHNFPTSPNGSEELEHQEETTLRPVDSADTAVLNLKTKGPRVEILIYDSVPLSAADRHMAIVRKLEATKTFSTISKFRHPTWISNSEGSIIWCNQAYRKMQGKVTQPGKIEQPLFDFDIDQTLNNKSERAVVSTSGPRSVSHWFDISTLSLDESRFLHTALNIDNQVSAETAQRKFVQTLAKTFAQLSIGLAIFDRDKRLVLFNPAMVDLTNLPAHFLSGQPSLQNFFDHLREKRILPEPKDYASWRKQIADLVIQSEDGNYQEIWHLPSGLVYRVSGRPHPDGAIALLIEDISIEMSITQRFKSQIELCKAAIDCIEDAMLVLDGDGSILLWNKAFIELVGLPSDLLPSQLSMPEILKLWKNKADFHSLRSLLSRTHANKEETDGVINLNDGRQVSFSSKPLIGSSRIITLHVAQSDRLQSGSAKIKSNRLKPAS